MCCNATAVCLPVRPPSVMLQVAFPGCCVVMLCTLHALACRLTPLSAKYLDICLSVVLAAHTASLPDVCAAAVQDEDTLQAWSRGEECEWPK